jgi:hypothetical protein
MKHRAARELIILASVGMKIRDFSRALDKLSPSDKAYFDRETSKIWKAKVKLYQNEQRRIHRQIQNRMRSITIPKKFLEQAESRGWNPELSKIVAKLPKITLQNISKEMMLAMDKTYAEMKKRFPEIPDLLKFPTD